MVADVEVTSRVDTDRPTAVLSNKYAGVDQQRLEHDVAVHLPQRVTDQFKPGTVGISEIDR